MLAGIGSKFNDIADTLERKISVCKYDYWNLFAPLEVFLNAFAKGLAKLLPKTLCDGIMNKNINK